MLSVWDPKVMVVGQMMALDGFGAQAQLLVDIFCNRAPATDHETLSQHVSHDKLLHCTWTQFSL